MPICIYCKGEITNEDYLEEKQGFWHKDCRAQYQAEQKKKIEPISSIIQETYPKYIYYITKKVAKIMDWKFEKEDN